MSDTKPLQTPVQETPQLSEQTRLLRQISEQLSKQNQRSLLHHTGRAYLVVWRVIATHVAILILGMSVTGYWMLKDDSWKNYLPTGCNPHPSSYSARFIPEPLPAGGDLTVEEFIAQREDRISQLTIFAHNLLLDRDEIRAVCGE